MNIITPQRGDRLVKEKNYVLLNRITNDSIYLYRYTVSGEHPVLSILQSGEKKEFHTKKWDLSEISALLLKSARGSFIMFMASMATL